MASPLFSHYFNMNSVIIVGISGFVKYPEKYQTSMNVRILKKLFTFH
jgi:hypothetical protein